MNEILRLTLVTLVLTIPLAAAFLVTGAFFPGPVARTRKVIHLTPGRAFGLGLVNFLFFGVIAFVLIYILACVFMLPGSVLTLGAGAVFGVVKGSAIVSVVATAGATATPAT